MVEGHTSTDGTASRNWDVSSQRALSVVQMLADLGVAPEKLTAAARGYFAPLASNSTQQGKIQNMRTVLIFTPNNDAVFMWAK
jgi:chemotaxis protein MotB